MKLTFLWAGAYFVAAVFVLTPVMDVTIAALPFRPGEMTWRFAATGIFAEGVMTALLGLFSALALAVYLEHRTVVKVLGVVSAIGCLTFLGVIGLFLIEAMQMRSVVAEEAQTGMAIASMGAFFKHLSGLIGTALMAMAARSELKHMGSGKGSQRDMVVAAGQK